MYCVYWIRLEQHTNPRTEGYVGISSNLKERLRAHKKCRKKTHFMNAVNKYGWNNLIIGVLHEGLTLQDALNKEADLRPSLNIGWNSQKGGELGVEPSWYHNPINRKKHSEATSKATIIALSKKDTREARSKRAKLNWENNPESYLDISRGSRNPRAILNESQVREIKAQMGVLTVKELSKLYGVKTHVIYQIKSGKNWSHI